MKVDDPKGAMIAMTGMIVGNAAEIETGEAREAATGRTDREVGTTIEGVTGTAEDEMMTDVAIGTEAIAIATVVTAAVGTDIETIATEIAMIAGTIEEVVVAGTIETEATATDEGIVIGVEMTTAVGARAMVTATVAVVAVGPLLLQLRINHLPPRNRRSEDVRSGTKATTASPPMCPTGFATSSRSLSRLSFRLNLSSAQANERSKSLRTWWARSLGRWDPLCTRSRRPATLMSRSTRTRRRPAIASRSSLALAMWRKT
mmetsp:Transcript_83440/g.174609  ORF Transcript_83440/g.174609 Transcript_83440/m.174609 type:complete len:260 (-) Transcript_83440:859-1638(-)